MWIKVTSRKLKLKTPVSISESVNHLLDFIRNILSAESSEEDDKWSQANSESSDDFTPTTPVMKVIIGFVKSFEAVITTFMIVAIGFINYTIFILELQNITSILYFGGRHDGVYIANFIPR